MSPHMHQLHHLGLLSTYENNRQSSYDKRMRISTRIKRIPYAVCRYAAVITTHLPNKGHHRHTIQLSSMWWTNYIQTSQNADQVSDRLSLSVTIIITHTQPTRGLRSRFEVYLPAAPGFKRHAGRSKRFFRTTLHLTSTSTSPQPHFCFRSNYKIQR